MQNTALKWTKDILWAISLAGLLAAILRFGLGLGATTGLNDASPWGLWIAFKLGFVALSGGGFSIAAMVYIFHLESYRPVLRRAILLALLGYSSFVVSLIFDLGLPWHIYMPIIHWQHHSVMFEIAWCVMLYLTVLLAEFAPAILEHPWFRHAFFQRIAGWLHYAVIPLVIAGIVLSTLHQSSLGALFLIMPHRVHPLWYSPLIPVLFLVSAIAAGMMALIVEGFLAQRLFNRPPDQALLGRLGKIGGFALWLYLALRLADLIWRGVLPGALDGSWESLWFAAEIVLGGLLPAGLLLSSKIRNTPQGLVTSALLAIGGILSQRMSLSLFTMNLPGAAMNQPAAVYRPALLEIIIAFAIPAAAGLVYLLFAENLAVLQDELPGRESARDKGRVFAPASGLAASWYSRFAARSGMAVLVIAVTVAALPGSLVSGRAGPTVLTSRAVGWEMLSIDGDRNGFGVVFPHMDHQNRLAGQVPGGNGEPNDGCVTCHHLAKPNDEATPCSECHRDFNVPITIFDHTRHTASLGGNTACGECHMGEHRAASVTACQECHVDMKPADGHSAFSPMATGYKDAMHGRCLTCHEQESAAQSRPELAVCSTCHAGQLKDFLQAAERSGAERSGASFTAAGMAHK